MLAATRPTDDERRRNTLKKLSTATPSVGRAKSTRDSKSILLHTFQNANSCRQCCEKLDTEGIEYQLKPRSTRLQLLVARPDKDNAFAILKDSLDSTPDTLNKSIRRPSDYYILLSFILAFGLLIYGSLGRWKIAVGLLVTYGIACILLSQFSARVSWFGRAQLKLHEMFGFTTIAALLVVLWIWAVN